MLRPNQMKENAKGGDGLPLYCTLKFLIQPRLSEGVSEERLMKWGRKEDVSREACIFQSCLSVALEQKFKKKNPYKTHVSFSNQERQKATV